MLTGACFFRLWLLQSEDAGLSMASAFSHCEEDVTSRWRKRVFSINLSKTTGESPDRSVMIFHRSQSDIAMYLGHLHAR